MPDCGNKDLSMTKKILIIAGTLIICSCIFVPWSIKTSLTFAWRQELSKSSKLAGWRLYQSTTSGGPYKLIDTIPLSASQDEYSAIIIITGPSHQVRTLYFVLRAFNTVGIESGDSNEVSMKFQAQGIMGYDFIWSGKRHMAINYGRVIMQVIGIVIGTVLIECLTSRGRFYCGQP